MRNEERTILVSRQELLAHLQENRDKHREQHKAVMVAYNKNLRLKMHELAEYLELTGSSAQPFRFRDVQDKLDEVARLRPPTNHEKDYEEALSIFGWDTRQEIEIKLSEFQRYVGDNWSWKGQFLQSSVEYGVNL